MDSISAPAAPPRAWAYVVAWAVVVLIWAYFLYYLVSSASHFGRRKSRLWLADCAFCLALYFAIIKPMVVTVFYVLIPASVRNHVVTHQDPLASVAFPFAAKVPAASYYVLARCPDLRDTPIGRHVDDASGGADSHWVGAHDLDDPDVLEDALEHVEVGEALAEVTRGRRVVVTGLSAFLALQEDLQDTIVEEVFAFAPIVFGPLAINPWVALLSLLLLCGVAFCFYLFGLFFRHLCCPVKSRRQRLHTRRSELYRQASRRVDLHRATARTSA